MNRTGNWFSLALACAFASVLPIGCFSLPESSLFKRIEILCRPAEPTEYPLTFETGPKKGKDVVVALFVASQPGIEQVCPGIDGKLASEIARIMPELAKDQKQKIRVINPVVVDKFKLKNPDWKLTYASSCGNKLGADYVIVIYVNQMSLYEQNSHQELYLCTAEVNVDVYDVDAGMSPPKWNYVLPFKYPHSGVIDRSSIPITRFRQECVDQLAAEICMKHVAK